MSALLGLQGPVRQERDWQVQGQQGLQAGGVGCRPYRAGSMPRTTPKADPVCRHTVRGWEHATHDAQGAKRSPVCPTFWNQGCDMMPGMLTRWPGSFTSMRLRSRGCRGGGRKLTVEQCWRGVASSTEKPWAVHEPSCRWAAVSGTAPAVQSRVDA